MVSLLKILCLPQSSFGASQPGALHLKKAISAFFWWAGNLILNTGPGVLRVWQRYFMLISALIPAIQVFFCSYPVPWLWSLLPVFQVSYLGITVIVHSHWTVNWRSAWSRILLGHSCYCLHRQWVAGVLHIFYKLLTPSALMKNFSSRISHTILPL